MNCPHCGYIPRTDGTRVTSPVYDARYACPQCGYMEANERRVKAKR